jgi:hypothetical protein
MAIYGDVPVFYQSLKSRSRIVGLTIGEKMVKPLGGLPSGDNEFRPRLDMRHGG